MKILAGSLVAAGLLLGTTPVAHADQASYIQYINDHNLRIPLWTDGQLYGMGVKICMFLHEGMSPQEVSDAQGPTMFLDNMGVIRASQETICPDTLR
ncbi:DUF732 domain-containing protein [Mycobacterium sp. SMC-11]|uniref:DUF732 domain-containing protein n=1 Tax=Mycobacterium sp. SMC-11 TaxID=3385969 RepID=UPI00390C4027